MCAGPEHVIAVNKTEERLLARRKRRGADVKPADAIMMKAARIPVPLRRILDPSLRVWAERNFLQVSIGRRTGYRAAMG